MSLCFRGHVAPSTSYATRGLQLRKAPTATMAVRSRRHQRPVPASQARMMVFLFCCLISAIISGGTSMSIPFTVCPDSPAAKDVQAAEDAIVRVVGGHLARTLVSDRQAAPPPLPSSSSTYAHIFFRPHMHFFHSLQTTTALCPAATGHLEHTALHLRPISARCRHWHVPVTKHLGADNSRLPNGNYAAGRHR